MPVAITLYANQRHSPVTRTGRASPFQGSLDAFAMACPLDQAPSGGVLVQTLLTVLVGVGIAIAVTVSVAGGLCVELGQQGAKKSGARLKEPFGRDPNPASPGPARLNDKHRGGRPRSENGSVGQTNDRRAIDDQQVEPGPRFLKQLREPGPGQEFGRIG